MGVIEAFQAAANALHRPFGSGSLLGLILSSLAVLAGIIWLGRLNWQRFFELRVVKKMLEWTQPYRSELVEDGKEFFKINWKLAPILFFGTVLWLVLFWHLFWGLIGFIGEIGSLDPNVDETRYYFFIAQLAGFSAVLAALVAFPFTILRLKETRKLNAHNTDALINQQIQEAIKDLYSRIQRTIDKEESSYSDWEDDVPRRSAAIARLRHLAKSNSANSDYIFEVLSTYIEELSQVDRPSRTPRTIRPTEPAGWFRRPRVRRRDLQIAFKALLEILADQPGDKRRHLEQVNLQYATLRGISFQNLVIELSDFSSAYFVDCDASKASFEASTLNGALIQNSIFGPSSLASVKEAKSTAFIGSDLSTCGDLEEILKSAFGDGSVKLPDGVSLRHWPDEELKFSDFLEEWQMFRKDQEAYIPPQHRT